MNDGVGRRQILSGGLAFLVAPAGPGLAAPPLRPRPRQPAGIAGILAGSGLGAVCGCAMAPLDGGGPVEAHQPDLQRPPASVAKVTTALYALDALGPDFHFRTRLRATGPLAGGTLDGDLCLEGGGDPVLDTDALAGLAAAARTAGLRDVAGRFTVATGALPEIAEIDYDQPPTAAYNPAVSGLNLNFNRVRADWQANGAGLALSAPGERHNVPVTGIAARAADVSLAVHETGADPESWELPRAALRRAGSEWLPVRAPGPYAAEVFGRLAAEAGVTLPAGEVVGTAAGPILAEHAGPTLRSLLRGMLRYSTNLTAEVSGLRATMAREDTPPDLGASAAAMTAWARSRFGLRRTFYTNHSGLGGDSRATAAEMVALLTAAAPLGLADLLLERPILDADRNPVAIDGVRLVAKTGTLDFTSALAGYLIGRRTLAFAIFVAEPDRRAAIRPEERNAPPGGRAWSGRARALENALLRHWATAYAA